jgi:hypothetical protein
MTTFARTPEGKVVLFRTSTGDRFERWPVDARDMLASGDYTLGEPSAPPVATAPVAASAPVTLAGAPTQNPVAPSLPPEVEAVIGKPVTVAAETASRAAPVQIPSGRRKK